MKKYLRVYVLLFTLFIGSLGYTATENECKTLYQNKQFDKAATCFYTLLSKDKNNPALRVNYGNCLFEQKKYSSAKIQYETVIRSYPNTNIAELAKSNLDLTNERLTNIKSSKLNDDGNYISEIQYSRWKNMPVKVWIQIGPYAPAAKRAFLQWQTKSQNAVSFSFVSNPNDANIIVSFKSNITQASHGDALGITFISHANNYIRKAQIDIKSVTSTGVKQTPNQIYTVVLHEVGHALGIRGHSKNPYDVMYPSDDNYRNVLSNRDVNTVKYMYK